MILHGIRISLQHALALLTLLALSTSASTTSAAQAAEASGAPQPVSYWNDVRPIFQANCQGCHQPAKASGEYIMTSYDKLLSGGETGEAAIVPHHPDASQLLSQITPVDGKAPMPQGKPPLEETQVALIKRWIEEGAIDDTPESAQRRYDAEHPPHYAAAPVVTAVQFSPDGTLLAVSGYHEVVLHDAAKALAGESSRVARLIGMSERIESVAFSPDGKTLAVAGGSPGRLGEIQV
ncbi:MAG: PD40 domain-containing protein [Planctomycetales bacterium]|nr:PD40 domain-containing protein [Planctomycetales bacterium]